MSLTVQSIRSSSIHLVQINNSQNSVKKMNFVGGLANRAPEVVKFSLGDLALEMISKMKWVIGGIVAFALASWAAMISRLNKLLEVPLGWVESFNKGLADAYA